MANAVTHVGILGTDLGGGVGNNHCVVEGATHGGVVDALHGRRAQHSSILSRIVTVLVGKAHSC